MKPEQVSNEQMQQGLNKRAKSEQISNDLQDVQDDFELLHRAKRVRRTKPKSKKKLEVKEDY